MLNLKTFFSKHLTGIIVILVFWLVCGFFIYKNTNTIFSFIFQFWGDNDPLVKLNSKKAYSYINSAENRIKDNKINLNIMSRSCTQSPTKFRGEQNFDPDLLDKIKNWKIIEEDSKIKFNYQNIAKYPDYWKKNYNLVLQSLQESLSAIKYSYEISLKEINPKLNKNKIIIIPTYVEEYSKAICQNYIAYLVWLDYVNFKEKKNRLLSLSNNSEYRYALQHSLGDIKRNEELNSLCKNRNNLICIDPITSIKVIKKLINISNYNEIVKYKLELSYAYIFLEKNNKNKKINYYDEAEKYLKEVSKLYEYEVEANFLLAEIYVSRKKYNDSLSILRYINLNRHQPGFSNSKFVNLAKRTLIGLGHSNKVDCFLKNKTQSINNDIFNEKSFCL